MLHVNNLCGFGSVAVVAAAAGPTPTVRSGSTVTAEGTGTSPAFTWPSGGNAPAANDIALVSLGGLYDTTISWPAGNEIAELTHTASSNQTHGAFWMRCTGSESGTFTATFGTSRHWTIALTLISGCKTSGTPYESLSVNEGTSTSATGTAITTTGANRLGVTMYSVREGWIIGSPPSGWTEVYDYFSTDNPALALDTKEIATASTESAAVRSNSNVTWITRSMAFLPT